MATELERDFLEHFPACFDFIIANMSPTKSVNAAYYEYCEKHKKKMCNSMYGGLVWLLVRSARSKNPIFRQWFELLISLGLDVNEHIGHWSALFELQFRVYFDDNHVPINTDFNDKWICKRLIEEGADIYHVDKYGTHMLSVAISDILAMVLIEAGVVTNVRNEKYITVYDGALGWSPFLDWISISYHSSRFYISPKKCKMFLNAGVDPKMKDGFGNNILKILCMYDQLPYCYSRASEKFVKEVLKPIENTCMIDMIIEHL